MGGLNFLKMFLKLLCRLLKLLEMVWEWESYVGVLVLFLPLNYYEHPFSCLLDEDGKPSPAT